MKSITILFFMILFQTSFYSQIDTEAKLTSKQAISDQNKFSILIENISLIPGNPVEIMLQLDSKGSYSFKLDELLVIPEDHMISVKDFHTNNTFNLSSEEPHSFSVNRAMTKRFILQVIPCSSEALTSR